MVFTKLTLFLFCVPFFKEMGWNKWASLAVQLRGLLSWRGVSARLGLGGPGIWTCASAGRTSHCCSDEQRLCSLLSLPKCTTGCMIFLKSLSFENLSFLRHVCHPKPFTALWLSECTFEARTARVYSPVSFSRGCRSRGKETGWHSQGLSDFSATVLGDERTWNSTLQ